MKTRKRQLKQCLKCLKFNHPKSKRCEFCHFKFTSFGGNKWLSKFKGFLNLETAFAAVTKTTAPATDSFFSAQEIESIVSFKQINIPMFLILDNVDLLDEKVLLELGGMLTALRG